MEILGILLIMSFDRRRNSYAKHNPPPLTLDKTFKQPRTRPRCHLHLLCGKLPFLSRLLQAFVAFSPNSALLLLDGFVVERKASYPRSAVMAVKVAVERKVWIIPHLWQVTNGELSLLLAVQTNPVISELLPCRAWGSESLFEPSAAFQHPGHMENKDWIPQAFNTPSSGLPATPPPRDRKMWTWDPETKCNQIKDYINKERGFFVFFLMAQIQKTNHVFSMYSAPSKNEY